MCMFCYAATALISIFDEAADSNGRTKMFYIIAHIMPRIVAKRGNLWNYSTTKLEARGARCKHAVRRQTCPCIRAEAGKANAGTAKTKAIIAKRVGSKRQK
eukprot:6195220-Pleurochrysis_carterae.AAC.5